MAREQASVALRQTPIGSAGFNEIEKSEAIPSHRVLGRFSDRKILLSGLDEAQRA